MEIVDNCTSKYVIDFYFNNYFLRSYDYKFQNPDRILVILTVLRERAYMVVGHERME